MSAGTKILGVDIGSQGALALLTIEGDLIEIEDMPTLRDGPKNRPAVNAPLFAELVFRWQATAAYIELSALAQARAP